MLEKVLKILFNTFDLELVKSYVQKQCLKVSNSTAIASTTNTTNTTTTTTTTTNNKAHSKNNINTLIIFSSLSTPSSFPLHQK